MRPDGRRGACGAPLLRAGPGPCPPPAPGACRADRPVRRRAGGSGPPSAAAAWWSCLTRRSLRRAACSTRCWCTAVRWSCPMSVPWARACGDGELERSSPPGTSGPWLGPSSRPSTRGDYRAGCRIHRMHPERIDLDEDGGGHDRGLSVHRPLTGPSFRRRAWHTNRPSGPSTA